MEIIGKCALCETDNVSLKNSHVVSKWTYRRLVGYDRTAASMPVMVADQRAELTSKQVTEKLLCGPCELLLSVPENYASKVGVQPDNSFPARDEVIKQRGVGGLTIADAKTLDVAKLTYFAISVIWRADVAQIEPIVHLGDARESIRQYLIGDTTLPAGADLFVTLFVPDPAWPRIDHLVSFPATTSESGIERNDFTACGMRFTLYTGGNAPASLKGLSFSSDEMVFISDGLSFLKSVASTVMASPATGSLARKMT